MLVTASLGCSGERPTFEQGPDATLGRSTTTGAPRPGTVVVEDWAEQFCTGFRAWQREAAEAGEELADAIADTSDPVEVRDSLVALLDHLAAGTEDLATDVRSGSVPDVDDGTSLIEALATRLDELASTFRGYRDQAEAIDVTDPDTFQADVDQVIEEMGAGQDQIAQGFEEIDRDFPDPVLQAALRRSCAPS